MRRVYYECVEPLLDELERASYAARHVRAAARASAHHRLAPMLPLVCASPAYIARHGAPQHPRDLGRFVTLALVNLPGFDGVWRFRRGDETVRVVTDPLVRSSNADTLAQCAVAGMGITVQADWIVGHELKAGTLVQLLSEWTVNPIDTLGPAVWALYPSRTYLPLKVRTFVAYLGETYRVRPPWRSCA